MTDEESMARQEVPGQRSSHRTLNQAARLIEPAASANQPSSGKSVWVIELPVANNEY